MEYNLDFEARKALCKQHLLSPIINIFSPPRGMADNEAAKTEYLKAMFEACNANLPTRDINRDSFVLLLDKIAAELIQNAQFRVWPLPNEIKKVARKHGQAYLAKSKRDDRAFSKTPDNEPERHSKEQAHLNGWTLQKCVEHFEKLNNDQQKGMVSNQLAHTMRKFPRVAMRRLFRAILNGEHNEAIPEALQGEFEAYQIEIARNLDQALQD